MGRWLDPWEKATDGQTIESRRRRGRRGRFFPSLVGGRWPLPVLCSEGGGKTIFEGGGGDYPLFVFGGGGGGHDYYQSLKAFFLSGKAICEVERYTLIQGGGETEKTFPS